MTFAPIKLSKGLGKMCEKSTFESTSKLWSGRSANETVPVNFLRNSTP
jgi:hypothetical protein